VVVTTPVTIEQAAAILGLSTSTVRRRIRAGVLRVEEISRPQGIMRLVYLPDDVDPAVTQVSGVTGVAATTPVTGSGDAMIAYTQTLLVPLVEALERSEARGRDQAEQLGRLTERLDHVTAQLEALRAPSERPGAGQQTPQPVEPTLDTPVPLLARLRTLAPWALAVLAIVAVIVLLGIVGVVVWVALTLPRW
jgi:hypothetical protein